MFAGNFAPLGWLFCDGSLLSIAENETLFQLIGTYYGGDGQETFALPDLRGRIPIHAGNSHTLAERAGSEEITLISTQIPAHTHALQATTARASRRNPRNALPAVPKDPLYAAAGTLAPLDGAAVGSSGGSQPHDNLQPYLCVNFIISLFGIYPSPP